MAGRKANTVVCFVCSVPIANYIGMSDGWWQLYGFKYTIYYYVLW